MPIVNRYYVVYRVSGHYHTADFLVNMTEESEENCLFIAIWDRHKDAETVALCGWIRIGS